MIDVIACVSVTTTVDAAVAAVAATIAVTTVCLSVCRYHYYYSKERERSVRLEWFERKVTKEETSKHERKSREREERIIESGGRCCENETKTDVVELMWMG